MVDASWKGWIESSKKVTFGAPFADFPFQNP